MVEEIWRDIPDYEGCYQISNEGRVKRLERYTFVNNPARPYYRHLCEKILTPVKDKDGYYTITLTANGIKKNMKIHRLVGIVFIENPDNLEQINHKDGNKANNKVSNLEWCDSAYNQLHAWKTGLKRTLKFAQIRITDNKVIRIFNSLNDIKNEYDKIDLSTVIKVCKGKRNCHYGFKWMYATDNMNIGDTVIT